MVGRFNGIDLRLICMPARFPAKQIEFGAAAASLLVVGKRCYMPRSKALSGAEGLNAWVRFKRLDGGFAADHRHIRIRGNLENRDPPPPSPPIPRKE